MLRKEEKKVKDKTKYLYTTITSSYIINKITTLLYLSNRLLNNIVVKF